MKKPRFGFKKNLLLFRILILCHTLKSTFSYIQNSMPAAAGAVAAAAIADQMLGPKEDRHLAIVLVY